VDLSAIKTTRECVQANLWYLQQKYIQRYARRDAGAVSETLKKIDEADRSVSGNTTVAFSSGSLPA
jgi:hypothetical protein